MNFIAVIEKGIVQCLFLFLPNDKICECGDTVGKDMDWTENYEE